MVDNRPLRLKLKGVECVDGSWHAWAEARFGSGPRTRRVVVLVDGYASRKTALSALDREALSRNCRVAR